MPPYRNPAPTEITHTRFIRIGEEIFVGYSIFESHKDIASMDNLMTRIEEAKLQDPTLLDAGFLKGSENTLNVSENSYKLGLPMQGYVKTAREITMETFRQQSPGKEIRG